MGDKNLWEIPYEKGLEIGRKQSLRDIVQFVYSLGASRDFLLKGLTEMGKWDDDLIAEVLDEFYGPDEANMPL